MLKLSDTGIAVLPEQVPLHFISKAPSRIYQVTAAEKVVYHIRQQGNVQKCVQTSKNGSYIVYSFI